MAESRPVQPAKLLLLLLAFLAYCGAHLLNNTLLAGEQARAALEGLHVASDGWIEPVLVRSLVVLGTFLIAVLWIGRRCAADIGWRSELVLSGLFTWLGAWLALQIGLVGMKLLAGQPVVWHARWTMLGTGGLLGGALAQALGQALAEDTAFRGFFLPELRARFAPDGSMPGTLLAIIGAALLFGLAHLPTRFLVAGLSGTDMLGEQWGFFTAGVALGVACLATRNVFAVIALHVLWSDPAPWIQVPGPLLHDVKTCVCAGVVLLAWLGNRRQVRPLERTREAPATAAPAVATPAVATPAVATPAVATPAVATPAVATPAAAAPAAAAPAAAAPAAAAPAAPSGKASGATGTPAASPAPPLAGKPAAKSAPAAPASQLRNKK